jgi:hypothetical protein
MATAEQSKLFTTFVGGLNTEATALNFPENAAQEIDNFDLVRTGEIKRRLGLDFETAYVIRSEFETSSYLERAAVSNSEWKAVNGKGDVNFLVVQVGMHLYFHDLGAEPTSDALRGTVDLTPYKTQSDADYQIMDTSYGQGICIVCNPGMNPVYISFDEDTETFTTTQINIRVRDFDGVDDGLETDERPTSLSDPHKYNLRNQGWPLLSNGVYSKSGSAGTWQNADPLPLTYNLIGKYPSNADIFWAARCVAAASGKEEAIGAYSAFALSDNLFGNTPAPKGHFIYDLFNQDKAAVSGIPVAADENKITDARPSATAFYAGRVWYAGIKDREYTGDVMFSQLLTDKARIGNCFQDQDPTAEDLNSLLATDGGVIHIADAGEVHRMIVMGQDLVLVCANGVWAITGTLGANFKADDFSVRKLTDIGSIGRDTIVLAENQLFWFSQGGIWAMQSGQIDDKFQLDRISRDTIQTFYDEDLGQGAKVLSRGFYDEFSKRIMWLYNGSDTYDSISYRFRYDKALLLDLTLPAFYLYSIADLDTNSPFVSALSMKFPGSAAVNTYDVVLGIDDVVLGADDVVQDLSFTQYANNKIKLLTFVQNEDTTYSYTFSEFNSRAFTDWSTWDTYKHGVGFNGADYTSVIQTGWNDYQAPLNDKHITHVTSYFKRTEEGFELDENDEIIYQYPSGALVQTRWEWTDLDVHRWTTPTEAYRLNPWYIPEDELDPYDFGYTIIKSKLRMRGHGHAFSIRYTSTPGNDMRLVGFAVNVRGATKV